MRVAHFIQRYPPARGGSEAYFERLGRHLVEAGHEVTVFTSNAVDLEAFWSKRGRCVPPGYATEHGVHVRRYPLLTWPLRRYVLKALSLFPHPLWQCLTLPSNPISLDLWRDAGRMGGFDAVHASAFPYAWPLACARRLARRLRVPFWLTPFLHLGDPDDPHDPIRRGYTTRPMRWLLAEADRIFVQTASEQQHVLGLGIDPAKVVLQGLGVDPAECTGGNRASTRQAWDVREGEIILGHLANQSREKGTIDLLLAAEHLWQRDVAVRVVLAGPQMPNFERFWRDFDARVTPGRRVVQLGVLDEPAKKDFFAGLDIFVLPSRSDSFGLVLLEAWANGAPNVAYRAGGIADVIRHETDGLLVPCGDVARLAEAMARLAQDAELRQRLGHAGRQRLPAEFRWEDKLEVVRRYLTGR